MGRFLIPCLLLRGVGPVLLGAALWFCMAQTAAADPAATRSVMNNAVGTPETPASDGSYAERRGKYLEILRLEAARSNVPPELADSVATVESGYDVNARGADGEVGLMQILPGTAAMLGFRGSRAELAEPVTNIHYGLAYLAQAWVLAGGNLCRTLMKYRAGHGEEAMTPLSVEYCRRALLHLTSIGSPLATGTNAVLPMATAPSPGRGSGVVLTPAEMMRLRRGQRTEADSRRYWEMQEARIAVLRGRLQTVAARRRGRQGAKLQLSAD